MLVRKKKAAQQREIPAWKLAMERAEDEPVAALPPLPQRQRAAESQRAGHDRSRSRSRERDVDSRSRSRSRERDHAGCHGNELSRDSSTPGGPSRAPTEPAFLPSETFDGSRPGYVFRCGVKGNGYYQDLGSSVGATQAEEQRFQDALAATAEDAGASAKGAAAIDDDAPIVAALGSHGSALDEHERATLALEQEVASWGRVSSTVRHAAEVLEVRLTDQLLQLDQMLDDCTTAHGRQKVKEKVTRLRALGQRLLKMSQHGR
jgi:hypothetical protein